MKPAERAEAEDKAKPWIARMQLKGPSPFSQSAEPTAQAPAKLEPIRPEPAKP